jgi:protein-S-isoprenylcysteine O-methyltransferase Ste14
MNSEGQPDDENAGAESGESTRPGMFEAFAGASAKHRDRITQMGAVVFAVLVLNSTDLWFEDVLLALAFDLFCFVLVMLGTLGRLWCVSHASSQKEQKLVIEGPYSVVRNPDYWFTFVGAAGVGLATEKVNCVLVVALLQLCFYPLTILGRELEKRKKYGDAFKSYAAKTPRFLPKFALFHEPETFTIFAKSHRRGLIRAFSLVPAFVLVLLVKFLQREWS